MSLFRSFFAVYALMLLGGCLQESNAELGKPCNLGFDAGSWQASYNAQAAECASSVCIKQVCASTSTTDTAPYCATTCFSDSDCNGQRRDGKNPDDHRCVHGYTCGVAFAVGSLCCQKLCLCKDFLGEQGVTPPPNCGSGDGQGHCGVD
jgi:hypothetical protein